MVKFYIFLFLDIGVCAPKPNLTDTPEDNSVMTVTRDEDTKCEGNLTRCVSSGKIIAAIGLKKCGKREVWNNGRCERIY